MEEGLVDQVREDLVGIIEPFQLCAKLRSVPVIDHSYISYTPKTLLCCYWDSVLFWNYACPMMADGVPGEMEERPASKVSEKSAPCVGGKCQQVAWA